MRRLFAAVAVCALIGIGTARGEDSVKEKQVRATSDAWVAAWNRHDPKSMAAAWTPEGDLINPFGRLATGRAEIEKLFTEEHATFMKGTTYSIANYRARFPTPAVAAVDWDGEVAGMRSADGKAMPAFKHHVFGVFVKKGNHWWMAATRASVPLATPGGPPAQ
jgi:uncharacterized protein (TIGR02246 family)